MNDRPVRDTLGALLSTVLLDTAAREVSGGCINRCFRYETVKGPVFVKLAPVHALDMFQAEAAGLEELAGVGALRTPAVLGVAPADEQALLALEWIDLHAATPTTDARLGAQLAALHAHKKPLHGWKRANFIGTNPQPNLWSRDWLHFWRTHRFDAQLDMAARNGADARFMERATLLSALMDGFFTSYVPVPSLLHGDLWGGNYASDAAGAPILFDPAVYYGDRECDLAMTRLFGGFGAEFYAAYQDAWPLDGDWQVRVDLYNLYHVLNHFNLFGGGYLRQASDMVESLLAQLGH